jgi:hypothetical protein
MAWKKFSSSKQPCIYIFKSSSFYIFSLDHSISNIGAFQVFVCTREPFMDKFVRPQCICSLRYSNPLRSSVFIQYFFKNLYTPSPIIIHQITKGLNRNCIVFWWQKVENFRLACFIYHLVRLEILFSAQYVK